MVEVFKTNVTQKKVAGRIVKRLRQEFNHYRANFDLDDVDRILRIVSTGALVDVPGVIGVLNNAGFEAEVLADTPPAPTSGQVWRRTKHRLHSAF